MNTRIQYLTAARLLDVTLKTLDGGKRWTKGCFACDAGHAVIGFDSPKAACFCAIGAMYRSTLTLDTPDRTRVKELARDAIAERTDRCSVAVFNDALSTTFADVERVLTEAADCLRAKAEKRG